MKQAKKFFNTNLPDPQEKYYSKEGITEDLSQKELDFEQVDNEQKFLERFEKEYPKIAALLKEFLPLKSPNAVFRLLKHGVKMFAGQFQGSKQTGIGALLYDDISEYGVGYFEDYKLDGPGIKYFYNEVKEGIFENDVLIEEKSLGLQSYSHLSKSSKAITSTLF